MLKKLFFLLLSSILVLSSCNDQFPQSPCSMDNEEGSKWLKQKMASLQNDGNMKAEIHTFYYKGNTVFLVNGCIDCVDFITSVYDCSGNEICRFGGIAGFNTCPGFDQEATNKKLLWKD